MDYSTECTRLIRMIHFIRCVHYNQPAQMAKLIKLSKMSRPTIFRALHAISALGVKIETDGEAGYRITDYGLIDKNKL